MIELPVHSQTGESLGTLEVDEALLGGEVRPVLLKQAYVRTHANKRLGTSKTKTRSEVEGSTRKMYKQKGTGNARRGSIRANILRGGGHAKAKQPRSWRQDMPVKMRRLANRNAILAKAVDGEIRLVDKIDFEKPSTKAFAGMLKSLAIDNSCLVAVGTTQGPAARSARNLDRVSLTHVDRLNVFDLLTHRYLVVEKAAFEGYLERVKAQVAGQKSEGTTDA
ncbi:50S ribosomal protein L4 [Mucisphaera calidilacus]|uniref:Large ribosomal subunit protein uL4 n=1 Tax=Mucisphaera calidilacus TaxID=2527982 RepID=A0A518BXR9_9BACT|nr:50S ribosomal protein L4 [Mucisphaera calidilacus]QDU71775.1 50S ribosomal protein L4 [Mucisphaera calidilacus]